MARVDFSWSGVDYHKLKVWQPNFEILKFTINASCRINLPSVRNLPIYDGKHAAGGRSRLLRPSAPQAETKST